MSNRLSVRLVQEDVCRYVGHHTRRVKKCACKVLKERRWSFFLFVFELLCSSFLLPFASRHRFLSRSYCPADPLLCLPGLLLLFIILRRESCCCFLSLCRCLLQEQQGYQSRPLPQRPLLCPCCRRCSVCDSLCVVTLIIMDSARVFRLSAGSWSTRTTLSSTCTQTCAGMRTHTHWWCAWLHTFTGAHMAAHAHKRNTHCAEV